MEPMMLYPSAAELFGSSFVVQLAAFATAVRYEEELARSARKGRIAHHCERWWLHDVLAWLGRHMFCRAFSMSLDSFWRLHARLSLDIKAAINTKSNYTNVGGRSGGHFSPPRFQMVQSLPVYNWAVHYATFLVDHHVISWSCSMFPIQKCCQAYGLLSRPWIKHQNLIYFSRVPWTSARNCWWIQESEHARIHQLCRGNRWYVETKLAGST